MMKIREIMNLCSKHELFELLWSDIHNTPEQFKIGDFEPLYKKIDDKEIEMQIKYLYEKSKG